MSKQTFCAEDRCTFDIYTKDEVNKLIVSDEYDSTATYFSGDLVIYNNQLYKCNISIVDKEEWTPEHWTETNINNELVAINEKFNLNLSVTDVEFTYQILGSSVIRSGTVTIPISFIKCGAMVTLDSFSLEYERTGIGEPVVSTGTYSGKPICTFKLPANNELYTITLDFSSGELFNQFKKLSDTCLYKEYAVNNCVEVLLTDAGQFHILFTAYANGASSSTTKVYSTYMADNIY